MGFVNGAKAERCRNNLGTQPTSLTFLVEHLAPWHLTLDTFTGTLPRITEILFFVNFARFLISAAEPFGRIQCLYRGDFGLGTAGRAEAASYTVERLRTLINAIPRFEDRLNESLVVRCDRVGEIIGTFTATLPPVIRLI